MFGEALQKIRLEDNVKPKQKPVKKIHRDINDKTLAKPQRKKEKKRYKQQAQGNVNKNMPSVRPETIYTEVLDNRDNMGLPKANLNVKIINNSPSKLENRIIENDKNTLITKIASSEDNDIDTSNLSIKYKSGQIEITEDNERLITDDILLPMFKDANKRVQILSYATSADNSASSDRRFALSRALKIKNWLESRGVTSSRISVRAIGEIKTSKSRDRVDFIFLKL